MVATIAGGTCAEYYLDEQVGYYTDGKEPVGEWYAPNGEFDLKDNTPVNPQDFLSLHSGHDLKGEKMVNVGSSLKSRNPAFDMTFSAPKSVSTLWAVGDESTRSAISKAQKKAVRHALDVLNENAAYARRGKGGVTLEKVTLTAGLFEHGEARPTDIKSQDLASDPQLHTHAVIMNLAEREDGSTGALDARHLFKWKMAAGASYRAALAHELRKELGTQIEVTDRSGLFEVVGVPKDVREHFSSRRSEILAGLDELGLSSKEAQQTAAKITKSSRNSKLSAFESREDQISRWSQEAEGLGFSENEVQSCLGHDHEIVSEKKFRKEAHKAILALTDIESIFEERHMVAQVAAIATEMGAAPDLIQKTVDELKTSKAVLKIGNDPLGLPIYSTPEQVKLELNLKKLAVNFKRKERHQLPLQSVTDLIDESELSTEQRQGVIDLTTKSDLAVLEGAAGAGKSHSLKYLSELYKAEGYKVIGSATAWKTAHQLGDDCGIESRATDSWLAGANSGSPFLDNETVLIVDEAGLLSSKQMYQILTAAKDAKAKVILTGDREQLQAIGAGSGLQIVADQVDVSRLNTIRRMEKQWARDAASNFARGNAREGIKAFIEKDLFQFFDSNEQLHESLLGDWKVHKIIHPKLTSLVIARTNQEVKSLNLLMRQAMRDMGMLSYKEVAVSVVNKSGNMENLPLAVGEHIRFGKKHDALGLVNGSIGEIESLKVLSNDVALSVKVGDQSLKLKLSDLADGKGRVRLQHAYATTLYSAQGMTVDRAFVSASHTFKRNDIYVATSRARGQTSLYADKETIGRSIIDGMNLSDRKGVKFKTQDITGQLSKLWSQSQAKISTLDFMSSTGLSKLIAKTLTKGKSITLDMTR